MKLQRELMCNGQKLIIKLNKKNGMAKYGFIKQIIQYSRSNSAAGEDAK